MGVSILLVLTAYAADITYHQQGLVANVDQVFTYVPSNPMNYSQTYILPVGLPSSATVDYVNKNVIAVPQSVAISDEYYATTSYDPIVDPMNLWMPPSSFTLGVQVYALVDGALISNTTFVTNSGMQCLCLAYLRSYLVCLGTESISLINVTDVRNPVWQLDPEFWPQWPDNFYYHLGYPFSPCSEEIRSNNDFVVVNTAGRLMVYNPQMNGVFRYNIPYNELALVGLDDTTFTITTPLLVYYDIINSLVAFQLPSLSTVNYCGNWVMTNSYTVAFPEYDRVVTALPISSTDGAFHVFSLAGEAIVQGGPHLNPTTPYEMIRVGKGIAIVYINQLNQVALDFFALPTSGGFNPPAGIYRIVSLTPTTFSLSPYTTNTSYLLMLNRTLYRIDLSNPYVSNYLCNFSYYQSFASGFLFGYLTSSQIQINPVQNVAYLSLVYTLIPAHSPSQYSYIHVVNLANGAIITPNNPFLEVDGAQQISFVWPKLWIIDRYWNVTDPDTNLSNSPLNRGQWGQVMDINQHYLVTEDSVYGRDLEAGDLIRVDLSTNDLVVGRVGLDLGNNSRITLSAGRIYVGCIGIDLADLTYMDRAITNIPELPIIGSGVVVNKTGYFALGLSGIMGISPGAAHASKHPIKSTILALSLSEKLLVSAYCDVVNIIDLATFTTLRSLSMEGLPVYGSGCPLSQVIGIIPTIFGFIVYTDNEQGFIYRDFTATLHISPNSNDQTNWTITTISMQPVGEPRTTTYTPLTVIKYPVPFSLPSITAISSKSFSFQIPASSFIDPNGLPLNYTILESNLPFPVYINGSTVYGSANVTQDTDAELIIRATNSKGGSADLSMRVVVSAYRAPMVTGYISSQYATVGTDFSFALPHETFQDPQGEPMNYTADGLPSWLSFDPKTQIFSGTPGRRDTNFYAVRSVGIVVHAYNQNKFPATSAFTIYVGGVSLGEIVVKIVAPLLSVLSVAFTLYQKRSIFLNAKRPKARDPDVILPGQPYSRKLETPAAEVMMVRAMVPHRMPRECFSRTFVKCCRCLQSMCGWCCCCCKGCADPPLQPLPGGALLPYWLHYKHEANRLVSLHAPVDEDVCDYVIEVLGDAGVIVEQFEVNLRGAGFGGGGEGMKTFGDGLPAEAQSRLAAESVMELTDVNIRTGSA